jgi:hypothetical protein
MKAKRRRNKKVAINSSLCLYKPSLPLLSEILRHSMSNQQTTEDYYFLGHRRLRRFLLLRSSQPLFYPYSRLHTHEYDGVYYQDGTGIELVLLFKAIHGIAISYEVYDSINHINLVYPSYILRWIDDVKEENRGPFADKITLFE